MRGEVRGRALHQWQEERLRDESSSSSRSSDGGTSGAGVKERERMQRRRGITCERGKCSFALSLCHSLTQSVSVTQTERES